MSESDELNRVKAQLEVVRLQNEIALLDRQWEQETNSYMLDLGGGWRVLLNRAISLLIFGFGFGGFGILIAFQPALSGAPAFVSWIGVAWTAFSIGLALYFCAQVGRFKLAEDAYLNRRARLVRQQVEKGKNAAHVISHQV